ncbi:unnamed protein product, partial [Adineta steineri]
PIRYRKKDIIYILITLITGVFLILGIAIPLFLFTIKKIRSSTTLLPSVTTTTTTSIPSTTKIESINTTSIWEITEEPSNTTKPSNSGGCTIS